MERINHFAVWLAGIVFFALGAVWYTALSEPWLDGIGKTREQVAAEHGASPLPYVLALAAGIVIAYALARLIPRLGKASARSGAITGAVLALVFVGSAMAMNYGFEGRPVSLWLINSGYVTAGMAIMGAIVGGWKRKMNP